MRSDWSALSRHHNLTETLTATLPTLRYQHVTWTCYMITTDVGFHFLRSVSFFSLSASGSVIRVTLMRRLLIICAVKMLLCVYVPSVYVCVCVCACVRVIRVKCWCLATALHLLSAFTLTHTHTHTHTHTRFDPLSQRCAVSPPGSTLRTTTQQLHPIPLFLHESLLPSSPSWPLPPFRCCLFLLSVAPEAFCQCSSTNWVPDRRLVFRSPLNRCSVLRGAVWVEMYMLDSHSAGVMFDYWKKYPAKVAVK